MTTVEKIRELALTLESEEDFDEARKAIAMVKRAFVHQRHAAALAADTSERDVPTEHCDVRSGCRYGYDAFEVLDADGNRKVCTVRSGEKIQSYCYEGTDDVYDQD